MPRDILDLVEYEGKEYVVVDNGPGRLLLSTGSWPLEFHEIDSYEAPEPVAVREEEVTLVEPASERIDRFNALLREHATHADQREGIDWEDVNRALEAAIALLPSQLLDVDMDEGDWRLPESLPDSLVDALHPAAIIIATHAVGTGEADVADIARAYERVVALGTGYPPAP